MATKKPIPADSADAATDVATDASVTPSVPVSPPALGSSVLVRPADGLRVLNNESGAPFEAGVDTPQTVTPTLLRRLADGDLVLVG